MEIYYFLIISGILGAGLIFNRNRWVSYSLLVLYSLALMAYGTNMIIGTQSNSEYFNFDTLGKIATLTLCLISIVAFFHGYRYVEKHNPTETPHSKGLFFGAMVILVTAIAVIYVSNHLAVSWIFVELSTLSASVLIYHHRNIRALEGVWKYVFVGAISVTFIYIGILFLSTAGKQAQIIDLSYTNLMQHARELNPFWLKLSFLFFVLGFSIKMSFIPMYTASIDAKDKAPAPAGAIFASLLMNAGFISVYRYYAILNQTPLKFWAQSLLLISALISLFVAAVYMTRVKNIKRMLAYSGIEHMSLMVIGITMGKTGAFAALLHMVLHSLIKPALFFQYNQIYWVYQSKSIYDIGNYTKYNKAGAIALLLGFVSLTAIPPSGLFVSEIILFQSLFSNHMLAVLIVVVTLLTIILWGLSSNVMKMLFTPPLQINESAIPAISPWESATQYFLPILAIYLAYFQPAWFINMISKAIIL